MVTYREMFCSTHICVIMINRFSNKKRERGGERERERGERDGERGEGEIEAEREGVEGVER